MSETNEPAEARQSLSRIPFSTQDESNILSLAWWLRASAIVTVVSVMAGVAEMMRTSNYSNVIGVVIMFICAVLSFQAAGHFEKVAKTDEADQDHILGGFRKLRLVYLLLSIWIITGLVFLCAFLLFLVVWGISKS